MTTKTLNPVSVPGQPTAEPPPSEPPPAGPPPGPPDPPDQGFGPSPDPTRSGALWVGGAGVALLLAAAAVLTAVRWDEIGQSVKLGGMVATTMALLAAGQRFKSTIPMTAHAIMHLGALLIPFDIAAIATLAGRSWQEALLLTSVTGVVAWYPMERAIGSPVLLWRARAAVVFAAAGIGAVSPLAMAPVLAAFAVIALVLRTPIEAITWAAIAAVLPLASFVAWPSRIAGAMADLGFDSPDRIQPLIAGVVASVTLAAVTRQVARVEVAWTAVIATGFTALVALGQFDSAQLNIVVLGALFVALELLAVIGARDALWKAVTNPLAVAAEYGAALATASAFLMALMGEWFSIDFTSSSLAATGFLLALGWLVADQRRLDPQDDWMLGMLVGSNWMPTTAMFPAAVLAATWALSPSGIAVGVVAVALALWMVATWRTGALVGAVTLITVAMAAAVGTSDWSELALGGASLVVMTLAARIRMCKKDQTWSVFAALGGVLALLVLSQSAIESSNGWAYVVVIALAWGSSWLVEIGGPGPTIPVAGFVGRVAGLLTLLAFMGPEPAVGLTMSAVIAGLAAVDYCRTHIESPTRVAQLSIFAAIAGGAVGLAGAPIVALVGFDGALSGSILAVAGFVVTGLCLASPRQFEIPLGAAAGALSLLGVGLAVGEASLFAFTLIVVGCSVLFIAAALRSLMIASIGYGVAAVGTTLQLAAFDVTWLEPYLLMPALAALVVGRHFHQQGISSWITYTPTLLLFSYVAIADRFAGGSAWHAVIGGAVGVLAVIAGGYRRLVGPLVTGSAVLAIVVGYESLGPAALVPTWAWLALGGSVLLAAGVAMERSDTTPLERGQQLRQVVATQYS